MVKKVSSKIIDKDFKEGAAVNASLEDLKEVVLQSGDLSYTCEIAKSADEKLIYAILYCVKCEKHSKMLT